MKPTRLLLLFNGFATALVAGRILRSGEWSYLFMLWNMFLAWVPFWAGRFLVRKHQDLSLWLQATLFLLWLGFLPNAPYMLTDLFHLRLRPGVPLWYDLVIISSFAVSGLILFYVSFFSVVSFLARRFPLLGKDLSVLVVFAVIAYGVYLGRYLRFNSWDALQHPFRLAGACYRSVTDAGHYRETLGFTAVFGGFLWFIYLTLKALQQREQQQQ